MLATPAGALVRLAKILGVARGKVPAREHRGRELGGGDAELLRERALERGVRPRHVQRARIALGIVGCETQLPPVREEPEEVRFLRIRIADDRRERARHRAAQQTLMQHVADRTLPARRPRDLVEQDETRRQIANRLEPEQEDGAGDRRDRLAPRPVEARVHDPQHLRREAGVAEDDLRDFERVAVLTADRIVEPLDDARRGRKIALRRDRSDHLLETVLRDFGGVGHEQLHQECRQPGGRA